MKKSVKTKEPLVGTVRIKTDGKVYEKTKSGWKKSTKQFPHAEQVIDLFKTHKNFKALIDTKNPQFLKGQLSKESNLQGARINILPDGELLDKAYSLFAPELTMNDESSHDHWDVIYKNPNGKYAYVYTLKKRNSAVKKKYSHVEEFEKIEPMLEKKILAALNNESDSMAMPMYTLIKTCMRVGNQIYYKTNKHKGLTTITKGDITITKNTVNFTYIGKDGIPLSLTNEFPSVYINRLKKLLKPLKKNQFVFVEKSGQPLKDTHFEKAFENYCGVKFYPHIVRSYYATMQVKDFLKKHKKTTQNEMNQLLLSICQKLGHKKFAKKDNAWVDSYTTTMNHYIEPLLLKKIKKMVEEN